LVSRSLRAERIQGRALLTWQGSFADLADDLDDDGNAVHVGGQLDTAGRLFAQVYLYRIGITHARDADAVDLPNTRDKVHHFVLGRARRFKGEDLFFHG